MYECDGPKDKHTFRLRIEYQSMYVIILEAYKWRYMYMQEVAFSSFNDINTSRK